METIKNYLENMFMNIESTPEVKKAKAELLSMMEDKYQELKLEGKTENEAIGVVISEFGNLEELAGELGIKEDISGYMHGNGLMVSLEEARQYCSDMEKASIRYAIGVLLCICSPILLILAGGLQEVYGFSDVVVSVTGLLPLLLLVGIAVIIFVTTGIRMDKYEYYKREELRLDFGTEQWVKESREASRAGFAIYIAIGVFLCIISVIPAVIVGSIDFGTDLPDVLAMAVFLAIVSIAVFLFVAAGVKQDAFHVLLQEEEYSAEKKGKKDIFEHIYWPVVVALYLAWSFITADWHITWIIWPVAGALSVAVEAIIEAASSAASFGKNNK